jgi:hypothetical protein
LFQRAVKSWPVHEKHTEKHQLLYTYTYEVQLHLRGNATYGYSYTYEVQLYLSGTVTLKRYSYTYDIQLLLGGKATPMKTATFKSTLKNIFRQLLNYLQFFIYNNENRLMLIKR